MELINESLPKNLASSYIDTEIDDDNMSYFVKFSKLFDFENSEYIPLSVQEAKDLYKEHPEKLQIIIQDNILVIFDENGVAEVTNTLSRSRQYKNVSIIDLIDQSIARYKVEFKPKDSSKQDTNFKTAVDNFSKFIDDINTYLKNNNYDYNAILDITENVLIKCLRDKISQVFTEYGMSYIVRFRNDIIKSDIFASSHFIWSANIPEPLEYYKNLVDDKRDANNKYISYELYLAICFTYNYNMLKRIGALNKGYPSQALDKLHNVCLDFFNQFNILLKMTKARALINATFDAIYMSYSNLYSVNYACPESASDFKLSYERISKDLDYYKQMVKKRENSAIFDAPSSQISIAIEACDESLTALENDINNIEQKLAVFINDEAFEESKIKLIKDLNRIDLEIVDLKSKLKK